MGILWSFGKRLFHWFSLESPQPIRFCLEIGFGIFLLNLIWMGLGLVRLWVEPLWLVGFVLLTLLFLKDLLKLPDQGFALSRPRGLPIWLVLICSFYIGFLLLHSLLPETFYDSLNYFLGMPSFWLWNHGICDYPTHLLSGYFHGGSLFFLNGFVLAGTEGAKVLAALVLFGITLFCYGWAKELGSPRAGVVAGTAVLTFPLLYLNAWAVRVDGLLTFVLLLFFFSVEKGSSSKQGGDRWIAAAGIFAGLALTIKPTAVVAIGAALTALLWRDGFKVLKQKSWMVFAGVLAFEVGPWFLKNACFTGNAFFPYAISWMGGRQFPAWSYQRLLHENQQFLPMDHGILSILNLPWRLTIPGAGDDQFIGPLLLAFLPFFLILRFKDPGLKFLGRTLLLSFVFGLYLSHMLRFSMPAFVMSFLILSVAFESFKEAGWRILWVGTVIAGAFFCFPQYSSLSVTQYDGWGIWSGSETRQEYLDRKMGPGYFMTQWCNENLPQNARLLVVGDAQVLYIQRPTYANSVFDEQFFAAAAREEKDPAGILLRLKKLGITHVKFDLTMGWNNAGEYHQYDLDKDQWRKIYDFVQKGLVPIIDSPEVRLYKVRDALSEKESRIPNPFHFFPPQAADLLKDYSDGNDAKAKAEKYQLLGFFPRDDYEGHMYEKEKMIKKMEKKK